MFTLLPLLTKLEKTKDIMIDILLLVKSKHGGFIKVTNGNKCHSVECLLEVLCYLKDSLIFPKHLDILAADNFLWYYVSNGLAHEDNVIRKRANYLLKRAIDKPFVTNVGENKDLQPSYSSFNRHN